jgi:argonaute-like protein implicated in RNA metabolism and viral defense
VPQPIDASWATCSEPSGVNAREKALSLLENVRACVQQITSSTAIRLVLVFIPDRWAEFANYDEGDEEINLHDLVKAYCVQRGIASQFLREPTLRKRFDCEVMWWLALSLYAKSMRTPWILDGLPSTTAFAGLGFGILRRSASKDGHIVLGCSHIYTSDGLGLNYRLSKIENPIFHQKNPHLSDEDALKLAEDIRQLFFESRGRLPERVVIHKRTPFLKAEREGLLRGLKEVPQVDLVEINVEAMMRCTASVVTPTGFLADGSPVDRGTAILLDKFKFLLWVNGNAHPNSDREAYYMGRFRIPAPVMVKKHWGPTDLNEIAAEVLALSKMNWNTFDLYTRLPATIHSSNEIARIGKLLKRFERESYDYRLFI